MIRFFDVVVLKNTRSLSGATERQNYVRFFYESGNVIFTKDGGRGIHRKVYDVSMISFFNLEQQTAEEAEVCQGVEFSGPNAGRKVLMFLSKSEKEAFVRLVKGLTACRGRVYNVFCALDTKQNGYIEAADMAHSSEIGSLLFPLFAKSVGKIGFEQFLSTLMITQSQVTAQNHVADSNCMLAETYENERYYGWVWCKLPDPLNFSNKELTERRVKELDFENWEWVDSEWKIDCGPRGEENVSPEKEGWLYSSSFSSNKWAAKQGYAHSVRRRRWIREGTRRNNRGGSGTDSNENSGNSSSGRNSSNNSTRQALLDFFATHIDESEQLIDVEDLNLLQGENAYSPLPVYFLPFGYKANGLFVKQEGTLIVTNYRILFLDRREINRRDMSIPLGVLERVEISTDNTQVFCLTTKDHRSERFLVKGQQPTTPFLEAISKLAFPGDVRHTFAFKYRQNVPLAQDGNHFYDPPTEHQRLGFDKQNEFGKHFRVAYANMRTYALCPTYPSIFIVPENITDETLFKVAAYRSQARLPATVFLDPRTGASLTRCAQPRSGLTGKKCAEDAQLIQSLREANPTNNKLLYFIDLRPYKAAMGNSFMGKGTESSENYEGTRVLFMDIDNIHYVRDSMEKMMALCRSDVDDVAVFFARLAESKWLSMVRCILEAAVRLVTIFEEEAASIVCHCSDGWDRTSQVTSLVKLMMDPYYRTRRGFAILVEQEWIAFGHKFGERYGQAENNFLNDQRAPVFLQWIDCVWQFMRQYPLSFEFSEYYLMTLADHVYSCRFGSFLVDTEGERKALGVSENTVSVWTFLCSADEPLFVNAAFDKARSLRVPLVPCVNARRIVLWERRYLRHSSTICVKESLNDDPEVNMPLKAQGRFARSQDMESQFRATRHSQKENDVKDGEVERPTRIFARSDEATESIVHIKSSSEASNHLSGPLSTTFTTSSSSLKTTPALPSTTHKDSPPDFTAALNSPEVFILSPPPSYVSASTAVLTKVYT